VAAAVRLDRADLAWELAHALVPWCDLTGHTAEWEQTHRVALAACRSAGDRRGEAVTQRGRGQLHLYQDRYDLAAEAFGRSRLLFARLGDDIGEAGAVAGIGAVPVRGTWSVPAARTAGVVLAVGDRAARRGPAAPGWC
jgi:hypothetical protein